MLGVADGFSFSGNVLLLRGHINVHSDMSALSADDLVQMVAERIIAANPVVRNLRATQLLVNSRTLFGDGFAVECADTGST